MFSVMYLFVLDVFHSDCHELNEQLEQLHKSELGLFHIQHEYGLPQRSSQQQPIDKHGWRPQPHEPVPGRLLFEPQFSDSAWLICLLSGTPLPLPKHGSAYVPDQLPISNLPKPD